MGTERGSIVLESNSRILFQGDSITDAGRNRRDGESLGEGYAMMVASWLSAKYPEKNVQFLNRGVGGDDVKRLRERWQKDCINLKPDVVSILVGINDVLGKFFWNTTTSTASFENEYRGILETTRKNLQATIVIIEPFALRTVGGANEVKKELDEKVAVVKKLSREFSAILVPMEDIFEEASRKREPSFWSLDGVHPTQAGHALIAQSWLEIVTNDSIC